MCFYILRLNVESQDSTPVSCFHDIQILIAHCNFYSRISVETDPVIFTTLPESEYKTVNKEFINKSTKKRMDHAASRTNRERNNKIMESIC